MSGVGSTAVFPGIVLPISQSPGTCWGTTAKPWMPARGRIAALTIPPALGRCDKPRCGSAVCWSVSEALLPASLRAFWRKACHSALGADRKLALLCSVELCPPEPCLPHPPFAVYLGFVGPLSLRSEDRVGLHPCGRMSLWPKSRKTLGREEWSAFLAFIPPWLPAKLDFWSQAQAQVELEGLAITIIIIPNNNS